MSSSESSWHGRLRASAATPGSLQNFGDKISLPAEVLSVLGDRLSASEPLALRIASKPIRDSPTVYGSVLDFTAPHDTAVLPAWMLSALDVSAGHRLHISLADDLPSAESLVLEPVDASSFGALHDHRAVLELALSGHFNTATEGTVVPISHLGRPYAVRVTQVVPGPAASLFNSEVTVDVRVASGGGGGGGGGSAGAAIVTTADGAAAVETALLEIPVGHEDGLVLPARRGEYRRAAFRVSTNTEFHLRYELLQGDVEVYLGDVNVPLPVRENHSHACTQEDVPGGGTIHVPAESSPGGEWRVAVRAYECDVARVKLRVLTGAASAAAAAVPAAAAIGSGDEGNVEQPARAPGMVRCENCMRDILETQFRMHSLHCARQMYRCRVCDRMVRRAAKETHWHCDLCGPEDGGPIFVADTAQGRAKHLDIYHTDYKCVCGFVGQLQPLLRHRRTTCEHRTMVCRFCFNKMPAGSPAQDARDRLQGLTQHEADCGNRTDECPVCHASVRLKDMEMHMRLHAAMDTGGDTSSSSTKAAAAATATTTTTTTNNMVSGGSTSAVVAAAAAAAGVRTSSQNSAIYVPRPMSPDSLAAARERAWAQAGFGGRGGDGGGSISSNSGQSTTTSTISTAQNSLADSDMERAIAASLESAGTRGGGASSSIGAGAGAGAGDNASSSPPGQLCSNVYCARPRNGNSGAFGTCSVCWDAASSGMGICEAAPALVKRYFMALTKGCGRADCKNVHCASGGAAGSGLAGSQAAAACVQLASEAAPASSTSQPPRTYLCTDAANEARRANADALADMGFELPWCVRALETTDGNSQAAAAWLLANVTE